MNRAVKGRFKYADCQRKMNFTNHKQDKILLYLKHTLRVQRAFLNTKTVYGKI